MKLALTLVILLVVLGQGIDDPLVVGKTFLAISTDLRLGSTRKIVKNCSGFDVNKYSKWQSMLCRNNFITVHSFLYQ